MAYDGHCAFKFRLYPNREQAEQIDLTLNACIRVWNLGLELKKAAYENDGTSLSYFDLNKMLPRWKEVLPWLKQADSQALQQSLRNLNSAYQNFFRRVKRGETPGYPKFKSVRMGSKSYKTPAAGRKGKDGQLILSTQRIRVVDEHHVALPKLGSVRCRGMQDELLDGRFGHILSGTVSKTPTGKYYLSIGCENVPQPYVPDGEVDMLGVRVGIRDMVTRSDGETCENPKALFALEGKLAREQRKLSRKRKGSANYERQRLVVARVHERIVNARRDAAQKATKRAVMDAKAVAVGKLGVRDMLEDRRKERRRFNRHRSDAAMATTIWMVSYKAERYGRDLYVIERGYPWTRTCSVCGAETGPNDDPSVRTWKCPECGTTHDMALNGAANIRIEGEVMANERL